MSAPAPIEVGAEAYIVRDGKLLLGLRAGDRAGSGAWALPGGRVKFLERADQAIIRELKEELNVDITQSDLSLLALTDDIQGENGPHHLHITFRVDIGDQEPQLAEPDACAEWRWFDPDQLPEPLFFGHTKIFDTIKDGRSYQTLKF